MLLSIVVNLLSSVNGTQSASQAASPLLRHGGATQPHDCIIQQWASCILTFLSFFYLVVTNFQYSENDIATATEWNKKRQYVDKTSKCGVQQKSHYS